MFVVKVYEHGGNDQVVMKYKTLDVALLSFAREVQAMSYGLHRNLKLKDLMLVVEGVVGSTVMTEICLYEEPE